MSNGTDPISTCNSNIDTLSPSFPTPPAVINAGPVVVKIPVVVAETTIQLDLDSVITIPAPVLQIKAEQKNIKIVQCRAIPVAGFGGAGPRVKLFLRGFVRKNIRVAIPVVTGGATNNLVTSTMTSYTTDVPFCTVADITASILRPIEFTPNPTSTQFEYFTSTPLPPTGDFAAKEELLSADLSEFNQISTEVFNELPYCELVSARFTELNEALNRIQGTVNAIPNPVSLAPTAGTPLTPVPFEEGTFTRVEEKMVVDLTLKVLQNQQVRVTAL